jgi:hypothetical protein
MPTIQLTDQLGLDADVKLADSSALLKYFKQLPALRLSDLDLTKVGGLTLDQPAIESLSTGVSLEQPVSAGDGGPDIFIEAGAHGSFAVTKATPESQSLLAVLSDDVAIPEDTCYVSFGIDGSVGADVSAGSGMLSFGVTPGTEIAIENYHPFPLHQDITLLDALRDTVGAFIIPARAEDLAALPVGGVATITGTGSLKLSVTADLVAVSNPLASVSLPAPIPALAVAAGGSVQVGASYEVGCQYQICAHRVDAGTVRMGWYRDRSSEVSVQATVSESLSASLGSTDLFSAIVSRISSDPAADRQELSKANLTSGQITAIQGAVHAAVARKLELALHAEIFATRIGDATFLYDIKLPALTDESRRALEQALQGNFSAIHTSKLPGISCVSSVWETVRKTGVKLQVNLLGILNFRSIATLTQTGSVLFEPTTGALVITDASSAQRIRSEQVNFGADTQKLRHVMAESFLITAAYHGTQRTVSGPSLHFSHSYFDLENQTSRSEMLHMLRTGVALGLFSGEEAGAPKEIADFGRTMIHISTEYDDGLATGLFLDRSGAPLPHEFYENAGRAAIQFLVADGDQDDVRRQPAINDALWAKMKDLGQPGFPSLFPNLAAPLLGAVRADYSTIIWWADAMTGAAQRLAAIRQWFDRNPVASTDDPRFQKLHQDLADHLKQVAAKTTEEFGKPWGLLAMNEAANRRPGAAIVITGPSLVRAKERALTAAASPAA